ncbi:MAG: hypothetical protein KF781_04030 [Chitinophagaceae bacterium]|nr:hypothetical protein [Chitinophagaceae bacterium]MCW5904745.1 hypothetical protein [Chitinophagaceae bacterium]
MKVFLFIVFSAITTTVLAQHLTNQHKSQLFTIENDIRPYAEKMIMEEDVVDRYRADSFFTKGLVKALKIPYSFYYNFDSINTISKLYAPDSSFKIFTWQLEKDYSSVRQKGAIQINTADGSLKLFPLFDASDDTENPVDSIRTAQRWIGALYYKIILTTYNNKKYYTLIGLDENNEKSNKKWIDVLTFDKSGNPLFGGRYFQYPNDEIKPQQPAYRFCIEYKKDARARVTYDEEMGIIVFDHLISEDNNPSQRQTLIPDGDFEGFRWVDAHWVYVNSLFDYKVDMTGVDPILGNPPVPKPITETKPSKKKQKKEVDK